MKYLMILLIVLCGCGATQLRTAPDAYVINEISKSYDMYDERPVLSISFYDANAAAGRSLHQYKFTRKSYPDADICSTLIHTPLGYTFTGVDAGCNSKGIQMTQVGTNNGWLAGGAIVESAEYRVGRILYSPQIINIVSRWKKGLDLSLGD